jgi:serine protease AprX
LHGFATTSDVLANETRHKELQRMESTRHNRHNVIQTRASRSMMHYAFALAVLLWGSTQGAIADESHPKLDPAVSFALAQATDTSTVQVIVEAGPGKFAAVRAKLLATGKPISAEHKFINALTVKLKKSDISSLESDPTVAHISLDHIVRSTAAPPAPPPPPASPPPPPSVSKPIDDVMLATLGLTNSPITGKTVGVAVIDSGLQPATELPAFAFFDFTTTVNGGAAYDDYGHGTHIAGLIRANAPPTNNPFGGMVGVSPGVRLISMKVLDGTGQGYTSTVLTALETVLNNQASLAIDVINLSLGHPITEPGAGDPLVQAVEALSRKGIVLVVAAGNWGRNPTTGLSAYAGITSPGNAPSALTVGALDTNQTVTRTDDQVPVYSSRGPTWYDGVVKPDVVAPGHSLVSLAAIGSSLYTRFPDQRVADGTGATRYMRLSGTSMATAVTTGVVALLIERHRSVSKLPLTPNDVKAVLQFTAIPVNGADVFTQGAGAVNPPGALAVVAALTGNADKTLRSTTVVQPTTTIGTETYTWNQAVIWGHTFVYGDSVYANEPAWGSLTTWGSAVIWGHSWSGDGDLVWDSAATWSSTTVWDPIIAPSSAGQSWPELGGQAVIWGHGGPY